MKLTFEQTQQQVEEIAKSIQRLESLMQKKNEINSETNSDNPLNIKEVAKFTGKSVPTIYSYVQHNEIPYSKKGNRLYFFKPQIIDWLKSGKEKTSKELFADVDAYLSNKNKRLK